MPIMDQDLNIGNVQQRIIMYAILKNNRPHGYKKREFLVMTSSVSNRGSNCVVGISDRQADGFARQSTEASRGRTATDEHCPDSHGACPQVGQEPTRGVSMFEYKVLSEVVLDGRYDGLDKLQEYHQVSEGRESSCHNNLAQ